MEEKAKLLVRRPQNTAALCFTLLILVLLIT